ncbi:uncharacterized protein LOC128609075 isoform X1 [Ictalurus furcatus]|uniref:uncharacterized protein LOC128609075 isoform X1 n=1 Tax=Ictalurus furcatus TaxID=66913 RepID=UPI00235045F1|nr:uncharacterized protein LOC128609075 isoform X1 [Ictalurus furcatus]
MDIITSNKVKLIKWLRVDEYILQHVQCRKLITMDEYTKLKNLSNPGTQITELLDLMLQKGQSVCMDFLKLLKEDDVNESSPELKKWITSVNTCLEIKAAPQIAGQSSGSSVNITEDDTSSVYVPIISGGKISVLSMETNISLQKRTDEKPMRSGFSDQELEIKAAPQHSGQSSGSSVNISATDGSSVYVPMISGSQISSLSMNMNTNFQKRTDEKPLRSGFSDRELDNQEFLRKNRGELIDNVKTVDRIVDDLHFTNEMAANVQAEKTEQAKMRKVLEYTNSKIAAQLLVAALWKHAKDVMEELTTT